MSCERHLQRQSSKSINSDLEAAVAGDNDEDTQSLILSGNIHSYHPQNLYVSDDDNPDDDVTNEEFQACSTDETFEAEKITMAEVEKAETIIYQTFGVNNFVKKFISSLLEGRISPSEFVVQGLVYKVQTVYKGSRSLRYLSSWGMFWAGIRNLSKSRGLVAFQEHFSIPTRLSTFKDMIIKMCGLQKQMLGKPGLQEENVRLFVKGKMSEIKDEVLCVSIALDEKKLAVTKEGREDMGGLCNSDTPAEADKKHAIERQKVLDMLKINDRKSLCSLYDFMSKAGKVLIENIGTVGSLIKSNAKRLEKNPRLNKYIYILNQKLLTGKALLKDLDSIQKRIIKKVSMKRNCLHLTTPEHKIIDLRSQANLFQLAEIRQEEEVMNIEVIDRFRKISTELLQISFTKIEETLSRPLHQIPRDSKTIKALLEASTYQSDKVYKACGLGKKRPLQDMKVFYEQSHLNPTPEIQLPAANFSIVATFCAHFAPLTFGANLFVREAGFFTRGQVVSTPELVIVDKSEAVIYCVVLVEVETNTFEFDEEMVTTAILSAYSCKACRGCLLVLYSDISCVVYSVPNDEKLAEDSISLINSYITAPRCLNRRSKDVNEKIMELKSQLIKSVENITTLGCYPLAEANNFSPTHECIKENFLKPSTRCLAEYSTLDSDLL